MLVNALTTLLAASSALLTSAAPVTREVLEAKDVGVLTCTTVFTGALQYDLGADYGYLSFTGPKNKEGLPILHTTRANGDKVPSHDFTFKKCTSNKGTSFIGPALGNEVGRGHIELTSSPGKCITRSAVAGKKHSQFVLAPCSFSDDSGQLLQSFVLGPKGYGEFLGHQGNDRPNWQVSLSSQEYKPVLAKIVDTDNVVGNLDFYFPTYVASTKAARDLEARDEEGQDVEARDVGVLTCTTTYSGAMVYNLGGDAGPVSFTGPKTADGLPILHTTRASGAKVPSHDFTFKVCKSNKAESFMGPAPQGSLGSGHLELTSSPGMCVTRNSIEGKKHSDFVLAPCSYSDDSGQLLQYFDLSVKGYLEFLGHRSGESPHYQLSLSKKEYTAVLAEQDPSYVGGLLFFFPSYLASTEKARDVEARDVEVKGMEARDVGVLTCSTIFTGVLEYFAKGEDPLLGNLSFTGPKTDDGLPILHTTRANGDIVPAHEFSFKNCTSNKGTSFIGSPTGAQYGIGHIELTSSPGQCITRHAVEGKVHSNFVLSPCSFSDDSSQVFQSFDIGPEGYVEFLGHRQGHTPNYELSLSSQEYRQVLAKSIGSGYTTASVLFKFPSYGTA